MSVDLLEKFFIPQKIKVGYREKEDTYLGLLAHITYYDEKGVLRRKASWDSQRDHLIEPKEFDNVPTEGFTINKSVGYSYYPSNCFFRIYDPRGFEFEITAANFIQITSSYDIIDKTFQGKFVYSWDKTGVYLLPCNTEEYKKSKKVSDKLFEKVLTADDLVPGTLYRVENTDTNWCFYNFYKDVTREFVYIGKVKLAKNLGKGCETKLLFYYISNTENYKDVVVPVRINNVKYSITENYFSDKQVKDILDRFNKTAWSLEFWKTPGIISEFNLPEERIKNLLEKGDADLQCLHCSIRSKLSSETKNLGYLDTTGNVVKVLRRKIGVANTFNTYHQNRTVLGFKNTYDYATLDISDTCSPIKVEIVNDLGKCKATMFDYWDYYKPVKGFKDLYPESKVTTEPKESTQPKGTTEIPLVYTTKDGYVSTSLHYMISTDCIYNPSAVFKYYRLPNKI